MRKRPGVWIFGVSGTLVLLVLLLVVLPPYLLSPRVVKSISDPSGRYDAEVISRPNSYIPPFGLLSVVTRMNVDLLVRIRDRQTGKRTPEALLTSNEDMEGDGAAAEIRWSSEGGAIFRSRNGERRVLGLDRLR